MDEGEEVEGNMEGRDEGKGIRIEEWWKQCQGRR